MKVDYTKLYDLNNFVSQSDVTAGSVLRAYMFAICSAWLFITFTFFSYLLITDTWIMKDSYIEYKQKRRRATSQHASMLQKNKNKTHKKTQKNNGNTKQKTTDSQDANTNSYFRQCCPCCACAFCPLCQCLEDIAKVYTKYVRWYQKNFSYDTGKWIMFMMYRECIELALQGWVLTVYGKCSIFVCFLFAFFFFVFAGWLVVYSTCPVSKRQNKKKNTTKKKQKKPIQKKE